MTELKPCGFCDERFEYRLETDFSETVGRIAAQITRFIDEDAVEQVEDRLAELGYVKVVRCRDCEHYRPHEFVLITDIEHVCLFWADGCKVEPDGFCAWAERKEGGE